MINILSCQSFFKKIIYWYSLKKTLLVAYQLSKSIWFRSVATVGEMLREKILIQKIFFKANQCEAFFKMIQ